MFHNTSHAHTYTVEVCAETIFSTSLAQSSSSREITSHRSTD